MPARPELVPSASPCRGLNGSIRRPQRQTATMTAMSKSFPSQSPACNAASLQATFSWTTDPIRSITLASKPMLASASPGAENEP